MTSKSGTVATLVRSRRTKIVGAVAALPLLAAGLAGCGHHNDEAVCVNSTTHQRVDDSFCGSDVTRSVSPAYFWWYVPYGTYVGPIGWYVNTSCGTCGYRYYRSRYHARTVSRSGYVPHATSHATSTHGYGSTNHNTTSNHNTTRRNSSTSHGRR